MQASQVQLDEIVFIDQTLLDLGFRRNNRLAGVERILNFHLAALGASSFQYFVNIEIRKKILPFALSSFFASRTGNIGSPIA